MKSLKLALVFSALVIFALSCSTSNNQTANTTRQTSPAAANTTPSTPAPPPEELAEARTDFNNTCVRCHKENGEGGTVELDDGKTLKIPSFKAEHSRKHPDKDFIRQISEGGDGMPAFKQRLSPERIQNLVRFIRKEFQSDTAPPSSSPHTDGGHK